MESEMLYQMTGERMTLEQAEKIFEDFLGNFKELDTWMKQVHRAGVKNQYVKTPTGRRRRFPYIDFRNRGAVERKSVNTLCQSYASDHCLTAVICLDKELRGTGAEAWCTIHDSILFLIPEDNEAECLRIIRDCMERPLDPDNFPIPLVVDINTGYSWGDCYD